MRAVTLALLAAAALGAAIPAQAQSVGYATGLPGRDPADDDGIGWGPAYRPETSFAQPGTPPTPGQIAGDSYRARTGRGVYDDVQGPLATGALAPGDPSYGAPVYRQRPRAARPVKPGRREAARRDRGR
jgi:hypothetical protein